MSNPGKAIEESGKGTAADMKEDVHMADRKRDQAAASDSSSTLGERAKAAGSAIKDGAQELKEGFSKDHHDKKAQEAANPNQ